MRLCSFRVITALALGLAAPALAQPGLGPDPAASKTVANENAGIVQAVGEDAARPEANGGTNDASTLSTTPSSRATIDGHAVESWVDGPLTRVYATPLPTALLLLALGFLLRLLGAARRGLRPTSYERRAAAEADR